MLYERWCDTIELTIRVDRNLVELDDRDNEEARSGLAIKISLERYRMFFVPGKSIRDFWTVMSVRLAEKIPAL